MVTIVLFLRIFLFCLYGDFRFDFFSWDRVIKMFLVERFEYVFSKV